MIPLVLQKIQMEQADAVIVVPQWPTQTWHPQLIRMLIEEPLLLPQRDSTLHLPLDPERCHSLEGKIRPMACRLSGQPLKIKEFYKQLRSSSSAHGDGANKNNTKPIGTSGNVMLVNNLLIPFNHQLTK